jgi:hypothetical protein
MDQRRLAAAAGQLVFVVQFCEQAVGGGIELRQLLGGGPIGEHADDQAAGFDPGRGAVGCFEGDGLRVHGCGFLDSVSVGGKGDNAAPSSVVSCLRFFAAPPAL